MIPPRPAATLSITRSAFVVMIGLVLSQVAGLLKNVVVAQAFGTGAGYDAFIAGNRLPEFLFNLIAGGALASAFIPTYTAFLVEEKRKEADRLASAVGSWLLILLAAGSVLCAVLAPQLVKHIIAPGFTDPQQIATTVALLRILLLCPTIFGLSGLMMGILNAHHRFFFSALAPMFYSSGWIAGVLLLAPSMGIFGLAWGVVAGAVMHFAVQLPALFSLRSRLRFMLDAANPAVRNVFRLMAPRAIGQSAIQLNLLVNTILASGLQEGSQSAIAIAFALMLMPEIAVAQAAGTAAFPTLSAQISRGQIDPMRATLASVVRGIFFLALPSAVGLILLGRPIVRMIFERGAFDAHSTDMVVWALGFYSLGLVAHSLLEVLARAFFAMQDTVTPVSVSVGGMLLNVVLSLTLVSVFRGWGWMPHGALALSNSLATIVEMTVLIGFLRRKIRWGLDHAGWLSLGRTMLASTVMAAALWIWSGAAGSASVWILGPGGILLGTAVFGAASFALGSTEAHSMARAVLSRIRPAAKKTLS
ncbi:MAG: murein biosynthesis integral membrane protein MurJ [Anaerolineales bacterium]|nr:murein biosynthesis integral membrane protein MurJ [Anaerolineales bacterium]